MRRLIILAISVLFLTIPVAGQVAERVYVSTDKDVYVAGDMVWCSVFCLDAESGKLSSANSVSYLEISSTEGVLVTGKIAMIAGRGSGAIRIPSSAPTGNYSLLAYTSSSGGRNNLLEDARLISVFNTSSSIRVKRGVEVISAEEYSSIAAPEKKTSGGVEVRAMAAGKASATALTLSNNMDSEVSISLSVFRDDGISSPSGTTLIDFMSAPRSNYRGVVRDGDGETLYGQLFGSDSEEVAKDYDLTAVVAFPGYAEDVYVGRIMPDGTVRFKTSNVYGNRDMVCHIIGLDDSKECRLVVESPFRQLVPSDMPSLKLSESLAPALEARRKDLRTPLKSDADTLYEFLPRRRSIFLSDPQCKRYHLDDYTRFPTIKETLIEITPDLRIRKDAAGKSQIQTIIEGAVKDNNAFTGNMLVMIDGVPVKDIGKLLEFDAMLVGDILVYPYLYSLGGNIFGGVVDFVTSKGDISSFKFVRNVVIVDWQGESYPVAFTCKGLKAGGEDLRNTLYWHPQIDLGSGETTRIEVRAPSYAGTFKVVAEGVAADGTPVRSETVLEVR